MIPAVPLIVRLALSAACIAVSKAAMATAGWITPELTRGTPTKLNAGISGIETKRGGAPKP